VLHGLYVLTLPFPRWTPARQRAAIARWSARLLAILSIRVHHEHTPESFPARCLVVMNHVSWLDIFLINAVHPSVFVAKSEIRGWPLVGALVTRAGTLYIERGSRAALKRTNTRINETLETGRCVACFPEGTTTLGDHVSRFHAGLFQPAIDAHATVLPVVVTYRGPDGRPSPATRYVGEDSLLQSLWWLLSASELHARVTFLPRIAAARHERRELSRLAHEAITRGLERAG
jgi:1-acyl-sn-glycerol-3-phosphate acyltransferase